MAERLMKVKRFITRCGIMALAIMPAIPFALTGTESLASAPVPGTSRSVTDPADPIAVDPTACPDSGTNRCPGSVPVPDRRESELIRYEFSESKMGVPVRLCFYATGSEQAEQAAKAVFARFDLLNTILSDYDPESEIVQVCRESGRTGEFVPVSDVLYKALSLSREYTDKTHGAFDITVSPLVKLWRRSRSFKTLPPADLLAKAKSRVGNGVWELRSDPPSVRVLVEGVRFDVGGIAKGLALDEGLSILQERGIERALLDAGGDLRLGESPPGEEGWRIEFATLDEKDSDRPIRYLSRVGVASSGDTWRYVEIDGVRYSHLIDPRTGEPLTRHQVVAVSASTAAEADVLASAVSILGQEEGTAVLCSFPGACLIEFLR